jgi:mRNA-degrading endonuclease RelE of RelBE toxin-antitoxin system
MEIKLKKQAEKYLHKCLPKAYEKLKIALIGLADWEGDIIKLEGRKNEYRLKLPPFRIIFTYIKNDNFITITKIDTRGDAYKKG